MASCSMFPRREQGQNSPAEGKWQSCRWRALETTGKSSSFCSELLHGADVVVPIVVEAVRHEVVAEGAGEITHAVLDAALGLEAENAFHLVRIDVIGAHVVGRRR